MGELMAKLSTAEMDSVIADLRKGMPKCDVRRKYGITKSQVTHYAHKADGEVQKEQRMKEIVEKNKDFVEEKEEIMEEIQKEEPKKEVEKEEYECGSCHVLFFQRSKFCPHCGVELQWQ
jgi:predicted transcriptional regulator